MKTLILIFGLILSTLILGASKFSMITNNYGCTVILDNQKYTSYSNTINIDFLRPGYHDITITKTKMLPRGLVGTVTLYEGSVYIPESSSVYAELNAFNEFVVTKILSFSNTYTSGYGNYYDNNYYQQGYYGSGMYSGCYGMSPAKFNMLKSTLNNTSFDSSKLLIAKQAIQSNGISSQQVYELMINFSFESNKLNLAKFAYPYVVDQNNYYLVNNAFTFSSSIASLNRYILSGN